MENNESVFVFFMLCVCARAVFSPMVALCKGVFSLLLVMFTERDVKPRR